MKEQTTWITEQIKQICENYKNRTAGAESTRRAMQEMAEQLRPWCDSVVTEEFTVAPNAFMGSIPLHVSLGICGVICYLLAIQFSAAALSAVSAVLFLLTALMWLLEYVLYRRAFDFLFRKRKAINVFAERRASGESKQRIILCGHADAAYESPFMLHLKARQITVLIAVADLGIFACLAFGILYTAGAVSAHTAAVFGVIEALLLLAFIPWLFFIRWNVVADGANDNLTACYIAMSILKEMAEKDLRLEHTDVCCLITDGEESGLRGAMAYAEAHRQELLDSNSVVIAMDTIHDPEEIMIYHRGINFTQKNSPEVCGLLREAGLACGRELPYAAFYPGATDAEAFSRYGIKAAALCAVAHNTSTYYHTRYDSWDNLNPEGIDQVRSIMVSALELTDTGFETGK